MLRLSHWDARISRTSGQARILAFFYEKKYFVLSVLLPFTIPAQRRFVSSSILYGARRSGRTGMQPTVGYYLGRDQQTRINYYTYGKKRIYPRHRANVLITFFNFHTVQSSKRDGKKQAVSSSSRTVVAVSFPRSLLWKLFWHWHLHACIYACDIKHLIVFYRQIQNCRRRRTFFFFVGVA